MIAAFAGNNLNVPVWAKRIPAVAASGSMTLRLVNMRVPYTLAYLRFKSIQAAGTPSRQGLVNAESTQDFTATVHVARSAPVRFALPDAPSQGHLSFIADPATSIVVSW